MAGLPAIARGLYLVLAVFLLACPVCSLGSRGGGRTAPETVVWSTIAPGASPATAAASAGARAQPAPTETPLAETPTAFASSIATVTPDQPQADRPAPSAPAAAATPRQPGDGPTPTAESAIGSPTPTTPPSPARREPWAQPTTELSPTAPLVRATATPVPRSPALSPRELRPEMLSEPGAPTLPRDGANLADATQMHPLLPLRPELAAAGAPDWLREGTRVLYEVLSATLGAPPGQGGGGSAGLMQYDLVAMDQGAAVSSVKFLLDVGTGGYSPSLTLYALGVPGSGDYWVNPEALRNAEDLARDELLVARTPAQIAGKSYNAVRLEYRPQDAEYIWMFDEESGILLYYRHNIALGAGKQQSSSMSLLSVRQLTVPWAGSLAPDWARAGATFAYSGAYTPIISGVGPTPLAYSVQFKVRLAQDRWWLCDVTQATADLPGNASQRLSGASQLTDALWIPPAALREMRRGQVLDSDPTTGIELVVDQVGRDTVVLAETGALHQSRLVYDARGGLLLRSEFELYSPMVTTRIDLELIERP